MSAADASKPVHVFLSFAPEDKKSSEKLEKYLTSLQYMGLISDPIIL